MPRKDDGPGRDHRLPPPPTPRRVSSSLAAAARAMGAEGAVELAQVSSKWLSVAGPQVAEHAWPQSLRQGVLVVAADHHAWAAELRSQAGHLLKELQARGLDVHALTVSVSHGGRPGW